MTLFKKKKTRSGNKVNKFAKKKNTNRFRVPVGLPYTKRLKRERKKDPSFAFTSYTLWPFFSIFLFHRLFLRSIQQNLNSVWSDFKFAMATTGNKNINAKLVSFKLLFGFFFCVCSYFWFYCVFNWLLFVLMHDSRFAFLIECFFLCKFWCGLLLIIGNFDGVLYFFSEFWCGIVFIFIVFFSSVVILVWVCFNFQLYCLFCLCKDIHFWWSWCWFWVL